VSFAVGVYAAVEFVSGRGSEPRATDTLTTGGTTTGDTTGSTTTGVTSKASDENALDTALAGLRRGSARWTAPTELGLHEQAEVKLVVSANSAIQKLRPKLDAIGRTEEEAQIGVSDTMLATLSGLGFLIEDRSEAEQYVAKEGYTTWTWSIEPTRTGKQHLHLTLSAVIVVHGRGAPYTVQTFETILAVNVTWPERVTSFVGHHWQFLWTALLLPIVGLVWRRSRRQNETEGSGRATTRRERQTTTRPTRKREAADKAEDEESPERKPAVKSD
jgi:hypothetical protein